ncbi:MAG: zinc ribbon domain-containing protein [Treponema sp.]|jgi:putative FmdB family regulatory protein|nr:zinc ribbon domain-containing protein [Treponema sp.]
MPTYEYECKKCSYRFEVFQSMSDEPVKKCPECGKEVRRLVSGGVGVIFKGSGFYVTDKQNKKEEGRGKKVEKKEDMKVEKKEDKTVTSNVSSPSIQSPVPSPQPPASNE